MEYKKINLKNEQNIKIIQNNNDIKNSSITQNDSIKNNSIVQNKVEAFTINQEDIFQELNNNNYNLYEDIPNVSYLKNSDFDLKNLNLRNSMNSSYLFGGMRLNRNSKYYRNNNKNNNFNNFHPII